MNIPRNILIPSTAARMNKRINSGQKFRAGYGNDRPVYNKFHMKEI